MLPAIGATLILGLAAILPLVIVEGAAASAGLFRFPNPIADIAAIVLLASGALWLVSYSFACSYAVAAIAIEDIGGGDGAGRTFALFTSHEIRKLTLIAPAQFLLVVGGTFAGAFAAGYIGIVTHSAVLGQGLQALVVTGALALGNIVPAVYYFDERIRH